MAAFVLKWGDLKHDSMFWMSQHRESHAILILSTWALFWMPFTWCQPLLYSSPGPFHIPSLLCLFLLLRPPVLLLIIFHPSSSRYRTLMQTSPFLLWLKLCLWTPVRVALFCFMVDIPDVMSRQISTPLLYLPIGIPYSWPVILCIHLWWKPFLASPIPRSPLLPLY